MLNNPHVRCTDAPPWSWSPGDTSRRASSAGLNGTPDLDRRHRVTDKMVKAALAVQKATRLPPPADFRTSFAACKRYLDAHPRQTAQKDA